MSNPLLHTANSQVIHLYRANPASFSLRQQFCWGPLGFLVAYCIAVQHPMRHALQIIISLGQIYGDVLYYATSMFDLYNNGVHFCRPEGYYFWFYYFFMNFIWIVVPSCKSLCSADCLMVVADMRLRLDYLEQSVKEIANAFRKLDELRAERKLQ